MNEKEYTMINQNVDASLDVTAVEEDYMMNKDIRSSIYGMVVERIENAGKEGNLSGLL